MYVVYDIISNDNGMEQHEKALITYREDIDLLAKPLPPQDIGLAIPRHAFPTSLSGGLTTALINRTSRTGRSLSGWFSCS